MAKRTLSVYWRVFAVNVGLLGVVALLLVVTPVTISAPIKLEQALIVGVGLVVALAADAWLLRRAVAPLEHLAQRMETVDLLRRGQRLEVRRSDEIGRVVSSFNRMLDRLEGERHESARRVLAAQEAERIRVARDLHDEVGQVLTGVLLQLNVIADTAPDHRGEIDEAKQAVRSALDEVRRISSELRPEMLEQLGLVSALTELSRSFQRASGVKVERRFEPSLPTLSDETELAVYRVAQESLTNIARHAQARHVRIGLESGPGRVVLRVVDDGRGLSGVPEENGGLRGMRERSVLVGGALAIKQAAGGGVEVRLEVPATPASEHVGVAS
jgi:two-component system, NarL family, sensor histidine kinase UhpB